MGRWERRGSAPAGFSQESRILSTANGEAGHADKSCAWFLRPLAPSEELEVWKSHL